MKGNIYTSEKCHLCGATLKNDENRDGCFCPAHPQVRASRSFRVSFGRGVLLRFATYEEARRELTTMRHLSDKGEYNERNFLRSNPRGFETMARKWLATKSGTRPRYYQSLANYIGKAIGEWGQRNVSSIQFGDIEDFILALNVSEKTRHNYLSALKQFFKWAAKRERIECPEFPNVEYSLGWREIISIETQDAIIEEVKRIAPERVYIGIKWLATYVAIRPHEMRELREADVNVNGLLVVRPGTSKEKQPKLVPMLEEDIALCNALPKGMPHLHFFRNGRTKGVPTNRRGKQIGRDAFYNWWKKACENLGVKGVDLYGGTRHSTATALGEHFTREELREGGTMHGTNKAFERYMQKQAEPSRRIYEKARQMRRKAN